MILFLTFFFFLILITRFLQSPTRSTFRKLIIEVRAIDDYFKGLYLSYELLITRYFTNSDYNLLRMTRFTLTKYSYLFLQTKFFFFYIQWLIIRTSFFANGIISDS